MAQTLSTMLPLGTAAPDFKLPNVVDGKLVSLSDFKDKELLLVIIISSHCHNVKHAEKQIAQIGWDYAPKGVAIVGLSANDPNLHSDDSPEGLRSWHKDLGFNFPIVYDVTQQAPKHYQAACTPEFYLFDQDRKLVYRGQLDDSRPKNDVPVTGKDLRAALDAALNGDPISPIQKASIGCSIKWIPGNEPDYYQGKPWPEEHKPGKQYYT